MQYRIYSFKLILFYYTIIIFFSIYVDSIYKTVHLFYITYNIIKLFLSVDFNYYRVHNITYNITNITHFIHT